MRGQTQKEEVYNAVTHGFGFVLSIVGFILLLLFMKYDNAFSILSVFLYGSSLLILYFVSTAYHYVSKEKAKRIFRKLDHISIYLLIAGTYSPVVLVALEHSQGWQLFWGVWGIAAIGTVLKLFFTGRFEMISVGLYLVMGWLIVLDFEALTAAVDFNGLMLLFGGGLCYTLGIPFYVLDRMKYNHVIWHVFVLSGSVFHYFFIFRSII